MRKLARIVAEITGHQPVVAFHDDISKEREKLPYEIDGVVIKVNRFDVQAEDFYPTGRMPRRERFLRVIGQTWSAEGDEDQGG